MLYYTLIPDRIGLIDEPAPEPADGQLPAYTSPRSISVQETVFGLWGEHDEIAYLLDGRMSTRPTNAPCALLEEGRRGRYERTALKEEIPMTISYQVRQQLNRTVKDTEDRDPRPTPAGDPTAPF